MFADIKLHRYLYVFYFLLRDIALRRRWSVENFSAISIMAYRVGTRGEKLSTLQKRSLKFALAMFRDRYYIDLSTVRGVPSLIKSIIIIWPSVCYWGVPSEFNCYIAWNNRVSANIWRDGER